MLNASHIGYTASFLFMLYQLGLCSDKSRQLAIQSISEQIIRNIQWIET